MPKNPAQNIDRYKINGGQLNEFEFHKNQAAMAEEERSRHEALSKSGKGKGSVTVARKTVRKPKKKAAKA